MWKSLKSWVCAFGFLSFLGDISCAARSGNNWPELRVGKIKQVKESKPLWRPRGGTESCCQMQNNCTGTASSRRFLGMQNLRSHLRLTEAETTFYFLFFFTFSSLLLFIFFVNSYHFWHFKAQFSTTISCSLYPRALSGKWNILSPLHSYLRIAMKYYNLSWNSIFSW